jgi:hypothetical protein
MCMYHSTKLNTGDRSAQDKLLPSARQHIGIIKPPTVGKNENMCKPLQKGPESDVVRVSA